MVAEKWKQGFGRSAKLIGLHMREVNVINYNTHTHAHAHARTRTYAHTHMHTGPILNTCAVLFIVLVCLFVITIEKMK